MIQTQDIKQYIQQTYPYIGETRVRELSRLIYEITKREKIELDDISYDIPEPPARFDSIKQYLVDRRYPIAKKQGLKVKQSYPDVDINSDFRLDLSQLLTIAPKNFYIEESVADCALAQRIRAKFSDANIEVIGSHRDHHKKGYNFGDYNQRLDNFYIIKEQFDFFKPCPCTPGAVSCGYHVANFGTGCGFECVYCYLQDYLKKPGILIPGNLEDYFTKFAEYPQNVRIGSGEVSDSLIFDHITGYSPRIVNFFRQYPKTQFEFKTKSTNIDGLLSVEGAGNVLVAWSVNPARVVKSMEFYTASLDERLEAAKKVVAHGYRVCFHFDPIIFYDNWKEEYTDVVRRIFDVIPAEKIGWISLGLLRMTPNLKKAIENRFPKTTMLDGELMTGYDQKIRYSHQQRTDMYTHMMRTIRSYSDKVVVYLCMEDQGMCSSQCSSGPTFTP